MIAPADISFGRPPIAAAEMSLLEQALWRRELAGDGYFTKQYESRPVNELARTTRP